MIASIIIPTHNHASVVGEAIASALVQTVACEVVVVDDGSTDGTADFLTAYARHPQVRVLTQSQAGPGAARNAGIDVATGEYVMFLDADDVIAPTKLEEQIAAFSPDIGWVLCDVRIEDEVRRAVETASTRYRYPQRQLGGWIRDQLKASNFIPVMSPLIRRELLGADVRFSDAQLPEDWHFWYRLAAHARVRYLPRILATYRKGRTGRSRLELPDVAPVDGPVRLNLGCGTPGSASWHPIPGFVNLDRSMGWCFEDGLTQYEDAAVDGITISHSLMYVDVRDMPQVLVEIARVLKPGGVVRITEDDTGHPESSRRGGWRGSEPAVTLTTAENLADWLRQAGLRPVVVTGETTHFSDLSLLQAQHGAPPDVFFLEGIKDQAVLFAPHADDETLFASFILQAHRPRVVVCCPSAGDYGETALRTRETEAAVTLLGAGPVDQWDGHGLEAHMREFDGHWRPARVWAPDTESSHPDHVAVASAARAVFGDRVATYHTYVDQRKVRAGREVTPRPEWIRRKLHALACYRSQIEHPRAQAFFLDDLREFVGEPR